MIYQSERGRLSLALLGDAMPSRRLRPYTEPDYLALRDLLCAADACFANLETTVRAPGEGYPNFTTGTPMTTDPHLLDDLAWFGVDFVSAANNHATDWGVSGAEAMIRHLRAARMPFAGLGANLAEARAPGYLDTPAGRIGLVAMSSFYRPWNPASAQRADTPGRPGINPLGFATTHEVTEDAFAALDALSVGLGLDAARRRAKSQFFSDGEVGAGGERETTLYGQKFKKADTFAITTGVNQADAEANLRAIAEARRQADWVVVSLHSHETSGADQMTSESNIDMRLPADFARDFARAAIDEGADLVVGHGPHLTLGVEIHKGRPILYSLGNVIFQNDTIRQVPAESYTRFGLGADATPADFLDARTDNGRKGFPATAEYWEGIAAVCRFEGGGPVALRLHPLDLGYGLRRAARGRPVLARGEMAARVLERVRDLSADLGTEVTVGENSAEIALA